MYPSSATPGVEHREAFIETNKQSGAVRENLSHMTATSYILKQTQLLVQQHFDNGNRVGALDIAKKLNHTQC